MVRWWVALLVVVGVVIVVAVSVGGHLLCVVANVAGKCARYNVHVF